MDDIPQDEIDAALISLECREIMRAYPTITNVTAAYNLLLGKFALCCVRGKAEDLKQIARDVYDGLLEMIDEDEHE